MMSVAVWPTFPSLLFMGDLPIRKTLPEEFKRVMYSVEHDTWLTLGSYIFMGATWPATYLGV
jgi:hypothetical protein